MKLTNLSSLNKLPRNLIVRAMDIVCTSKGPFKTEKVLDNVYRGSDVPIEKISTLPQMGINTVVNLRTLGKKQLELLKAEYKKYNIEFVNFPINPFNFKKSIPVIVDFIKNLKKDSSVLVHCTYGKHRTGGVIAVIKSALDKTSMTEIIDDMYSHGFKRSHKIFFGSIKRGLKKLEKFITSD